MTFDLATAPVLTPVLKPGQSAVLPDGQTASKDDFRPYAGVPPAIIRNIANRRKNLPPETQDDTTWSYRDHGEVMDMDGSFRIPSLSTHSDTVFKKQTPSWYRAFFITSRLTAEWDCPLPLRRRKPWQSGSVIPRKCLSSSTGMFEDRGHLLVDAGWPWIDRTEIETLVVVFLCRAATLPCEEDDPRTHNPVIRFPDLPPSEKDMSPVEGTRSKTFVSALVACAVAVYQAFEGRCAEAYAEKRIKAGYRTPEPDDTPKPSWQISDDKADEEFDRLFETMLVRLFVATWDQSSSGSIISFKQHESSLPRERFETERDVCSYLQASLNLCKFLGECTKQGIIACNTARACLSLLVGQARYIEHYEGIYLIIAHSGQSLFRKFSADTGFDSMDIDDDITMIDCFELDQHSLDAFIQRLKDDLPWMAEQPSLSGKGTVKGGRPVNASYWFEEIVNVLRRSYPA
ncbi:hypothetical protein BKA70DRAFT_1397895 [Coprinopsis sp. MPI-PUGE-AT-0042]|nr:hypothetical protein BKA70DRAFT_1397895 [Coprinopsis sp. MPI-PUGE-AT-0042]